MAQTENKDRQKVFLSNGLTFNPATYQLVKGFWELKDVSIDQGGQRFHCASATLPSETTMILESVSPIVMPPPMDALEDATEPTDEDEATNN